MTASRLMALACLVPITLSAETFIIDFNDVDDPDLATQPSVPLRDLDVPGGFVRDGGVITNSWPTNTALVDAVPGADLAQTAATANYFNVQGPPNPVFGAVTAEFEDDQGRGRVNYHDVADFAIGTAWVSFLVRLDPDPDNDGDGPVSGGVTFGNLAGYTGSTVPTTVGTFLGLSHLPAGVTGGPATVVEWSTAGLEFASLTTSGPAVVRGVTSPDLGIGTGNTHLVIARLQEATNTIEVWVDPADATSAATLGAPDLAAGLGISTITHLGVYGEADEAGVASVEHVKAAVDNLRVSNEALALEWATGRVDPLFDPSAASYHKDYAFGTVFGGSSTQAVEFVCESAVGNTVTVNSITVPDDGGGVFSLGTLPSLPLVLNDGDTISIPVIATGTAGSEASGQILIDTTTVSASLGADANDKLLPISATFMVEGIRLNANPFMDVDLDWWGGGSARVEPGIAPGSIGMARVKGTGDPEFFNPDSLFQADGVPNGAQDWELTFYFSPHSTVDFGDRVDPAGTRGITGPRGEFADRTFQVAILASDDERADPVFDDAHAANTLINLAYLPGGNTAGGAPDFYLYHAPFGGWIPTGLGAVLGSVDANDDGVLDTTAGDTVRVYRMRIVGTGFGSPGASFRLTLSGGELAVPVTTSNLAAYHGVSPEVGRPAGYAFTTGDTSSSSNPGDGNSSGFTTSFWVDDVSYFAGSAPDPQIVLLGDPAGIGISPPETTGTAELTIRNDGANSTLNVSPLALTGAGLSVTSPAGGVNLAPGAAQSVEVLFDSAVIAPGNATAGELTVTSNDAENPAITAGISASVTSPFQRLANGDFEAAGFDDVTDYDSFAVWNESGGGGSPPLTRDVKGLVAGSATAAFIEGNTASSSASVSGIIEAELGAGLSDFEIDFYFAVKDVGRQLNLHLRSAPEILEMVNIRYEAGVWSVYGDTGGGSGWKAVIDHTAGGTVPAPILPSVDNNNDGNLGRFDLKRVYRLHISGRDFGSAEASYSLQVYDQDDTTLLGDSGPLNFFRNNVYLVDPLRVIRFASQYGGGAGFWVDEVEVKDAGFETLDSDGDQVTDLYENAHGLNAFDPSDASSDTDHDGQTALQESIYGTAANDSASRFTMVFEDIGGGAVRITYGPLLDGNDYMLCSTRELSMFSVIDEHVAGGGETGTYRVVVDPTRMPTEIYKVIVNCR